MNDQNIHQHRRLLDMLAGWASFAEKYASILGFSSKEIDAKEIDAINDLYQEAGNMTNDHLDQEPSPQEIQRFVIDKVIPVLLNGVSSREKLNADEENLQP